MLVEIRGLMLKQAEAVEKFDRVIESFRKLLPS